MQLVILLFVLALAGCAQAPKAPAAVGAEFVAVVPDPEGRAGSVVVRSGGTEQVLDRPYAARRLRPDGSAEPATVTPEDIRRDFAGTLDALPGRPTSFLLYFLEGKDELTASSRAELEKVFAELKRRPAPDIVVIGHTDTVGNLAFNDKLSLARAERVRDMLVSLGIDRSRIEAAGRGEREPLVPTEDNVAEGRNRRVEISVR